MCAYVCDGVCERVCAQDLIECQDSEVYYGLLVPLKSTNFPLSYEVSNWKTVLRKVLRADLFYFASSRFFLTFTCIGFALAVV